MRGDLNGFLFGFFAKCQTPTIRSDTDHQRCAINRAEHHIVFIGGTSILCRAIPLVGALGETKNRKENVEFNL